MKRLLCVSLLWLSIANPPPARAEDPVTRGVVAPPLEDPSVPGYAQRHALLIGIDEYEDPEFQDLQTAVDGARAMARTLIERFEFRSDNVRLILDQEATQGAIAQALEEWATDADRIGPDDLLVVYFAGHGLTRTVQGRRPTGYLVPADGRTRGITPSWSSLVAMSDLEQISEMVPAKHALFLLDSCFSGLAVPRSNSPVVPGLRHRARQVITAGSGEQAVLDRGQGHHSEFTAALLDALSGAADTSGDEAITVGELFTHISAMVTARTPNQTPLQMNFPDHEGGNVTLYRPGVRPGSMDVIDQLRETRQTLEQKVSEMVGYSDELRLRQLLEEADSLFPCRERLLPEFRDWRWRARELLTRRPEHEHALVRLREQARLEQLAHGVTGPLMWEAADPELQWRHETLQALLERLDSLDRSLEDVDRRIAVATTLHQRTVGAYQQDWLEAIDDVFLNERYDGLELSAQTGLVPLGLDPESGLWEFWLMESGARPERDATGDRWRILPETGLVFVLVPGGSFVMGGQSDDPEAPGFDPDALPGSTTERRRIEPFFLSKYEMTQGQWRRLSGQSPSLLGSQEFGERAGQHPVENVRWSDCDLLLRRWDLDLPTEAMWEYAARAGTSTRWWTGNEPRSLADAENIADRRVVGRISFSQHIATEPWDDGHSRHAPVGSYRPNPFGLHDMLGNVHEMCADAVNHDGDPIVSAAPGHDVRRVFRGGAFLMPAVFARAEFRSHGSVNYSSQDVGARPILRSRSPGSGWRAGSAPSAAPRSSSTGSAPRTR